MMNVIHSMMSNTQNGVLQSLYNEFKSDKTVDSWRFVNSPWPIGIILAAYLTFVLKLGPKLMESRKPFNLRYLMLAYNLMQVLFNAYIVLYIFITPEAPSYLWKNSCHPENSGNQNHILLEFHKVSWYFAVSKVIDLLDTVFFVLRKKQSQVSFLHTYHHVNMVLTCFFHLRFIKNINATIIGTIINSFVHVVMYTYYFLAALGPQMQKYLWWKRYLTRIQIIQFLFCISYTIGLFTFNCSCPKLFLIYFLADTGFFLYLFLKFYKITYKKNKKVQ